MFAGLGLVGAVLWPALGWAGLTGATGRAALGWVALTGATGWPFAPLGLVVATVGLRLSGHVGAAFCAALGWAGLIGAADLVVAGLGSLGDLELRAPLSVLGFISVIVPPGLETPGMRARDSGAV